MYEKATKQQAAFLYLLYLLIFFIFLSVRFLNSSFPSPGYFDSVYLVVYPRVTTVFQFPFAQK